MFGVKINSKVIDRLFEIHKEIGKCDKCELNLKEYGTFLPIDSEFQRSKVMFVGAAPSGAADKFGKEKLRNWNVQESDYLLQDYIEEYFGSAYVTELLKCGEEGKGMDIKEEEADNCAPFLKEEIEALKPKAIAYMGRETGNHVKRMMDEGKIPQKETKYICHPAYLRQRSKDALVERWDEQFPELKRMLNE